eukprot:EG_transcript_19934
MDLHSSPHCVSLKPVPLPPELVAPGQAAFLMPRLPSRSGSPHGTLRPSNALPRQTSNHAHSPLTRGEASRRNIYLKAARLEEDSFGSSDDSEGAPVEAWEQMRPPQLAPLRTNSEPRLPPPPRMSPSRPSSAAPTTARTHTSSEADSDIVEVDKITEAARPKDWQRWVYVKDDTLHIERVYYKEKRRHLLLVLCLGVVVLPLVWLVPTLVGGDTFALGWLPLAVVAGLWTPLLYWGLRLFVNRLSFTLTASALTVHSTPLPALCGLCRQTAFPIHHLKAVCLHVKRYKSDKGDVAAPPGAAGLELEEPYQYKVRCYLDAP